MQAASANNGQCLCLCLSRIRSTQVHHTTTTISSSSSFFSLFLPLPSISPPPFTCLDAVTSLFILAGKVHGPIPVIRSPQCKPYSTAWFLQRLPSCHIPARGNWLPGGCCGHNGSELFLYIVRSGLICVSSGRCINSPPSSQHTTTNTLGSLGALMTVRTQQHSKSTSTSQKLLEGYILGPLCTQILIPTILLLCYLLAAYIWRQPLHLAVCAKVIS